MRIMRHNTLQLSDKKTCDYWETMLIKQTILLWQFNFINLCVENISSNLTYSITYLQQSKSSTAHNTLKYILQRVISIFSFINNWWDLNIVDNYNRQWLFNVWFQKNPISIPISWRVFGFNLPAPQPTTQTGYSHLASFTSWQTLTFEITSSLSSWAIAFDHFYQTS